MMSGCFSNRSGPGCRPWISRPPSSTAVEFEPGMPKHSVGTSAVQATALLAASRAATTSGQPLPNPSACFDERRASLPHMHDPMLTPAPGIQHPDLPLVLPPIFDYAARLSLLQ